MPRFAIDIPHNMDVDGDLDLDTIMRKPLPKEDRSDDPNSPISRNPDDHTSVSGGGSFAIGSPTEEKTDELLVLPIEVQEVDRDASPLKMLIAGGGRAASPSPGRVRIRDVRVYCNFLTEEKGKLQSFNVRLRDQGIRGRDVIEATVKAFLSSDERLVSKFSDNPREYKLYLADDQTGEEETRIQSESPCGNFTCMALIPYPGAYLSQFPQRSQLLAPPFSDIPLTVEVRGNKMKHQITLPADLQVNKLEAAILRKLPVKDLQSGSLRVRYGPVEVSMNEAYNFGPGCGAMDVHVGERTLVALHRYGVSEVVVEGTMTEESTVDSASTEDSMSMFRRMDEEEARAYQHFDVIKTNKFGVRQERVMGVDGDRIYNMRPSTEIGKTKNPERNIADIDVIRGFAERPNYCEIEYKRSARFDTDKIEFKNALECSIFLEKLKVLKKMHDRKQHGAESGGALGRFFSKFGFGK